jgi:hypothetical protein
VPARADLRIVPAPGGNPPFPQAYRLEHEFAEGWRFIRVSPRKPLPIMGRPQAVGMWIYSPKGTGDFLRCRVVDATGTTYQPLAPEPVTWEGWRWITLPLDDPKTEHWGGAIDGRIHYPLRWDTLLLVDSHTRAHSGVIYFTGITLLYEAADPP